MPNSWVMPKSFIEMKFLTCVNKRYIISNQQYVFHIMYYKYVLEPPLNFLQNANIFIVFDEIKPFNGFITVKIPTPRCSLQPLKFCILF